MTSEQNIPEVQSHQGSSAAPIPDGESQYAAGQSTHGMGQSKSSRRRRRKRKNKGTGIDAAAQPQGDTDQPSQPAAEGAAPAQVFQQPQPGQQPGNGTGNGAKRWKKKFRDRGDRPRNSQNPGNGGDFNSGGNYQQTHQPGNSFKRSKGSGGGGGKQQRGLSGRS